MTPSDQRRKLSATDRQQRFKELFDEQFEIVRRYVWRRDPALCDDVVAETFLVAWRRLDDVPANAAPWLIGVARKTRLNMVRSRRRQAAVADRLRERSPRVATAPADELPPEIGAALAALAERDREILLLSVWDELERGEIASVLGCSTSAAGVRLHRAKKRFTAALTNAYAAAGLTPPNLIPGGASDAC